MKKERKLYIETYGCQMNISDSEIVSSILLNNSFVITKDINESDLILINTCAIRDNAEHRVFARLKEFKNYKTQKPSLIIGVLGCMAERLKEELLEKEKSIDLIAGPDSYRQLPQLLEQIGSGQKAINVILSVDETYANINPVRLDDNGVSAFVSIMRGCENFCSYCVVPFTRGKERSRNHNTIIKEAQDLFDKGYREITLLGQNVNSYKDAHNVDFADLIKLVADINPLLRVRFATSHPKDISDKLIKTIANKHNICKCIHLPIQSGSNSMLKLMNRRYTREWYLERINAIKTSIPKCSITTDIISGFCNETELDHNETLSIMKEVKYDYAYMFKYSERPGTLAAKKLIDNVSEDIKSKRLEEIIALQQQHSLVSNKEDIGKTFEILVETISKKSDKEFAGRNSQNKMVVFPRGNCNIGDYVNVQICSCTAATLKGKIVE